MGDIFGSLCIEYSHNNFFYYFHYLPSNGKASGELLIK